MSSSNEATDVAADANSTGVARNPSERDRLIATMQSIMGGVAHKEYHSFKGDKFELYKQVQMARGPKCVRYDAIAGRPLNLQDYYIHPVQLAPNSGGEIVDAVRCVLIEPDGTCVAFVSESIAKELCQFIYVFGEGPYIPAIRVNITLQKTRRGTQIYCMSLVD